MAEKSLIPYWVQVVQNSSAVRWNSRRPTERRSNKEWRDWRRSEAACDEDEKRKLYEKTDLHNTGIPVAIRGLWYLSHKGQTGHSLTCSTVYVKRQHFEFQTYNKLYS